MHLRHTLIGAAHVSLAALSVAVAAGCATTNNDFGSPVEPGDGSVTTHDGETPHSDGGSSTARDSGRDTGTAPKADASHEASAMDATSHDAGHSIDAGHDVAVSSEDTGVVDASHLKHDAGVVPVVYGQSASVLYSLNTMTNAVTTVGLFIGCDSSGVIDIALDKDSNMYATTFQGVYTVDTTNAACTVLAMGTTYPNSLSFVPAGTVDPMVEALVGYQGSTYVRINTTTGAITTIGSLGDSYTSSGDIVSVIGGGTYLTVTGGTDCTSSDCLVEVNPSTGAFIMNYGSVKHSAVYGLAFWAGNVYGFDNGGDLFEVSFPDAGGLVIADIAIPMPPLGLSFYGAGSTTAAPKR